MSREPQEEGGGEMDAQVLTLHQPVVQLADGPILLSRDLDELPSTDGAVVALLGLEGVSVDRLVAGVLRRGPRDVEAKVRAIGSK